MKKTSVTIGALISLLTTGPAAQIKDAAAAAPVVANTTARPAGMKLEWTYFIGGSKEDNFGAAGAPVLDHEAHSTLRVLRVRLTSPPLRMLCTAPTRAAAASTTSS